MPDINKMLKGAMAKGQGSIDKHIASLTEQNEAIIERLNWIMKTQQKVCDKLDLELDDPLEEEGEE